MCSVACVSGVCTSVFGADGVVRYGTGGNRVQEDVWVSSVGLRFLISSDSTIFSSATSLHVLKIYILKEAELMDDSM